MQYHHQPLLIVQQQSSSSKSSSSPSSSLLPLASTPQSSKYQAHLLLRIDQQTLNETVENNTLFCTHIDAWKYFARDALSYNKFKIDTNKVDNNKNGATTATVIRTTTQDKEEKEKELLFAITKEKEEKKKTIALKERQHKLLESEQPGCVHTTMDLLKMALKLGPYCNSDLFYKVLKVTLQARSLDVRASPYDVSKYSVPTTILTAINNSSSSSSSYNNDDRVGGNNGDRNGEIDINDDDDGDNGEKDSSNLSFLKTIKIETSQGRIEYKQHQIKLMKQAQPIRKKLLKNYDQFIVLVDTDH